MKQAVIRFLVPCILLLSGASAAAQIFGGTDSSGTVVLSDFSTAESRVLIVAAPTSQLSPAASRPAGTYVANSAYASFISEASQKFALPAALIHSVIKVESNFNPNAKSPKGALGLMQLMPQTARRFGSTDAMDPRDNILTGSQYLRWLLDHFNQDLELAIAAYNAGEGAVARAGQKVPNIAETQMYVPKVMKYYQQILNGGVDSKNALADVLKMSVVY
jgi:soluble lytic murein transglycosylase-like protein